jgi:hypothetical protein
MSIAIDVIERLGTEQIRCDSECQGVECRKQKDGYYPRAFFLDPGSRASEVEVAIVGKNPGHSTLCERQFYQVMAEQHEDRRATYRDCTMLWNYLSRHHPYYQKPKQLLEKLALTRAGGILWGEVVLCESKGQRIPGNTVRDCSKHLEKILNKERLLPDGKHIFCLGDNAYDYVTKILGHNNRWKVVRVYHPTGRYSAPKFAWYRSHIERFKQQLVEWNKNETHYAHKFPPPGICRSFS